MKPEDEIKALKDQLAEEQAAREAAENALQNAKETGTVSPPVPGTFTVSGEDASGKAKRLKFKFKDGRLKTTLPDGQKIPSAVLMALANGKEVQETAPDGTPWKDYVSQEDAQARLEYFVAINAGFIEPAKA